jgi:hypothetical protein
MRLVTKPTLKASITLFLYFWHHYGEKFCQNNVNISIYIQIFHRKVLCSQVHKIHIDNFL